MGFYLLTQLRNAGPPAFRLARSMIDAIDTRKEEEMLHGGNASLVRFLEAC